MLPHEKYLTPVPVINDETGSIIGEAVPANIVGAHMKGNYHSYIRFKDKDVVCSFDPDQPTDIRIFPSREI